MGQRLLGAEICRWIVGCERRLCPLSLRIRTTIGVLSVGFREGVSLHSAVNADRAGYTCDKLPDNEAI
jgi:hypothetical protein